MSDDRYVPTAAIRDAVRGRETEVLKALGITPGQGTRHIRCPYRDHADSHPSWRWDQQKAQAYCTCLDRPDPIFDVVMRCEGIDFEAAKRRVAEVLGRHDLIRSKGDRSRLSMDAESLLQPRADQRDDDLGRAYFANRLDVPPADVLMPTTAVVGWSSLPYYDPPGRDSERPELVGYYPCVVCGTVASDGRDHAQRVYVDAKGHGKADLRIGADGRPRDPKKSARLKDGQSTAGCAVLWGDPAAVPHLILAEGAETAAAVALAYRNEIEAGEIALAAALSTGGVRAFEPWPATRHITVAADRDEDRPPSDRGYRAGEKAARDFAARHHERVEVGIVLPGAPGEDVDWLDVLRSDGVQAVRAGIDGAEPFTPPAQEEPAAAGEPSEDSLFELVERAKADRGAPFEPEALTTLATARHASPATYQRIVQGLKQAGVRMRDLDREVRRAGLRVIQGGSNTDGVQSTVEAGPYFITDNGMIAWSKETREGPVPQPLCNFAARIVAEEVFDDGAEQRTVLVLEGELPDKQRLPAVRIAAERFATMTWVTETWGTAAIVFAGQGKRDHLRVALQMLSGDVLRQIVYGHLGWRWIGDRWAYLHHGAGIDRDGAISTVEVDAGVDGLLPYNLPEPPEAAEAISAVRASLAILDLGPDAITVPVLGGVYRAPLGEVAPIDFSIHLTGPTGVFKSELAALGQAHFGSGFNSRSLPASWADTANMLEKKSFLAKDVVITVDDFAPTGTTADVQRLHREADRLFRGAGNRSGRARMRADGAGRPTYYPRGLPPAATRRIGGSQPIRSAPQSAV